MLINLIFGCLVSTFVLCFLKIERLRFWSLILALLIFIYSLNLLIYFDNLSYNYQYQFYNSRRTSMATWIGARCSYDRIRQRNYRSQKV